MLQWEARLESQFFCLPKVSCGSTKQLETHKYISYIDGSSEFTSDEMVFENSLQSGVNPSLVGQAYEGDVKIVTDAIKVNNAGSDVVLEDVDILGRTDTPAEMKTELGDGTKLVILNGNDNLTDGEKDTLNIANVENNNVYKNEPPAPWSSVT